MKTHQQILGQEGEDISVKYLLIKGMLFSNEITEMVMPKLILLLKSRNNL